MLMLWGHSRGPFGLFTDRPDLAFAGPFAEDDPWSYRAQTLTPGELRMALRCAREQLNHEVDIMVFKDCFMSTLETAYELKDAASYIIASPDIVPVEGWPYEKMFDRLVATRDTKAAATAIIGDVHRHYAVKKNRSGFKEVPFTLMDTSKVTQLSEPLRMWSATSSR